MAVFDILRRQWSYTWSYVNQLGLKFKKLKNRIPNKQKKKKKYQRLERKDRKIPALGSTNESEKLRHKQNKNKNKKTFI